MSNSKYAFFILGELEYKIIILSSINRGLDHIVSFKLGNYLEISKSKSIHTVSILLWFTILNSQDFVHRQEHLTIKNQN